MCGNFGLKLQNSLKVPRIHARFYCNVHNNTKLTVKSAILTRRLVSLQGVMVAVYIILRLDVCLHECNYHCSLQACIIKGIVNAFKY